MLHTLKKWFGHAADTARHGQWRDLARWAEDQNCSFRPVREVPGFVVDGHLGPTAWRLEWGPSQRSYVRGQELRIRAELNLPYDLQALVLSRELQEAMERDVFDQYVESVQTRADTQTPPEMRWLVMFPRLSGHELKRLRERWAAVASFKPWLERWLDGPLAEALAVHGVASREPLALVISRGRLVLRTGLDEPDGRALQQHVVLFETALREAQRVAADFVDVAAPTTQPGLWSASALAGDSLAH
jgi:hypothetical protein